MTTLELNITSPPHEIIRALLETRDAMTDPDDLVLTVNQRAAHIKRQADLGQHAHVINMHDGAVEECDEKLAPLYADRSRLEKVDASLDRQIEDHPDRVEALTTWKTRLRKGVSHGINGKPILGLLEPLFTTFCVTCNKPELHWHGPLEQVQKDIKALETKRAEELAARDVHVRQALVLLQQTELTGLQV